ncbi:MAG: hypothetical protein KKF44_06290 [Nanoarchaeota archaeon]|nr:hypothetical protein [Nanoarchaeota archaeon]
MIGQAAGSRRSQVSMEFIIMIGLALAVMITFIGIISELIGRNVDEKKKLIIEDFGLSIQNEFIMASEANLGYRREFVIPVKIEGIIFDITNDEKSLKLNYSRGINYFRIPDTIGFVVKGNNLIQNENGTVCINC